MKKSLEKAIQIAGSQTRLAKRVGKEQGHVWDWLNKRAGKVPAELVCDVAKATGWKVTPHSLRPDIYRHPEDGLPAELRGLKKETD